MARVLGRRRRPARGAWRHGEEDDVSLALVVEKGEGGECEVEGATVKPVDALHKAETHRGAYAGSVQGFGRNRCERHTPRAPAQGRRKGR